MPQRVGGVESCAAATTAQPTIRSRTARARTPRASSTTTSCATRPIVLLFYDVKSSPPCVPRRCQVQCPCRKPKSKIGRLRRRNDNWRRRALAGHLAGGPALSTLMFGQEVAGGTTAPAVTPAPAMSAAAAPAANNASAEPAPVVVAQPVAPAAKKASTAIVVAVSSHPSMPVLRAREKSPYFLVY